MPAVAAGPVQPRIDGTKRGPDNFGREQQLQEFRRTNGLCFKCGNQYSQERECTSASS